MAMATRWALVAVALTACSPTHRYYEATAIEHEVLAAGRKPALVKTLQAGFGDRAITWCDADGVSHAIQPDGEGLNAMELTALHAVWLTEAIPDPVGGEFDLLISAPQGRVPVSVYLELDESIYVVSGDAISAPPEITVDDVRDAFDIGDVRDEDAVWDAESLAGLAAALALLDASELAALTDVDFVRRHANPDTRRDALYVQEGCEARIYIYDSSLTAGRYRFVGDPDHPLPPLVFTALHEIGHAVHEYPARSTACELDDAVDEFNDRQAAFNERIVARNRLAERAADDPRAAAEVDRLDPGLDEARARLERARNELRSLRARAVALARRGPVIGAFETALGEDPPPTAYGEVSVKEAFAESFALFRADPAALRRVNQRVFAWFGSGAHHEHWRSGSAVATAWSDQSICRLR